ncbi:MAG: phage holin family protein [Thermoleophilia bacterium]|nr:phage holin family protein [Thermoleophilia bacterium]
MIYRVLGGIALALGGIFGLIALLVLLPFLSNYNVSLLVLTAVFGIIAYVFLAIGWQLLHPPKVRQAMGEGPDAENETAAAIGSEPVNVETPAVVRVDPVRSTIGPSSETPEPVAPKPAGAAPAATAVAQAPESSVPSEEASVTSLAEEGERREAAATTIRPGPGFAGFDEEPADPAEAASNGESGRKPSERFKKPGAAVPHHESRR